MKAIILSNIPLNEEEQTLLRDTNLYKLALNHHAEELKPHARIFTDYVDLLKIHYMFPNERIYTTRARLRYPNKWIKPIDIDYKGSTIISAIEFLISQGVDKILLIADNTVHSKSFQNLIRQNLHQLKKTTRIYQFRQGNFPLEVKEISEFLWNT